MGRGRRVGRGDLDEIDYWWIYGTENPMVMGLSSCGFWWWRCGRESDGRVMRNISSLKVEFEMGA